MWANLFLRGRGERPAVVIFVILFLELPLPAWLASLLRLKQRHQRSPRGNNSSSTLALHSEFFPRGAKFYEPKLGNKEEKRKTNTKF